MKGKSPTRGLWLLFLVVGLFLTLYGLYQRPSERDSAPVDLASQADPNNNQSPLPPSEEIEPISGSVSSSTRQLPSPWRRVEVDARTMQRWLTRLAEPSGYVRSAVAVVMDPGALVEGVWQPGQSLVGRPLQRRLRLQLDDQTEVVAQQTRVDSHLGRMVTWVGEIPGEKFSDVFLTFNQGMWHGHVKLAHRTFELAYGEGEIHLLREVDTEALPPDHPGDGRNLPTIREAADTSGGVASPDSAVGSADIAADVVTIRLLAAYTTDAKNKAGGASAIEAMIGTGTSQTTTAFSRGGVQAQMQLAVTKEYDYAQQANMQTDLTRFSGSGDSFMDDVHGLRDTHQADMNVLLVGEAMGGACGIGYLLTSSSPALVKSVQFSVVARPCATGYYSFSHELGHNLGNHHDLPNAPGGGYFSYSTGHYNEAAAMRTIMAYPCPNVTCTRYLYFSAPAVLVNGVPSGVENVSDNARSLSTTTPLVAHVYGSPGSPVITTQPQGQNLAVGGTINLSVVANGSPAPSYQWFFNGTAIAGATAANYTELFATSTRSGLYKVRVFNTNGEVYSNEVTVNVHVPIQITVQPVANQTVSEGSGFSLSVVASGTGPLRYQWYRAGSEIAGATSATYSVASANASNVGSFTVRVSGPYSFANSNAAIVSLGGPPQIVTQPPATVTLLQGSNLSIATVAVGGTEPFIYQWYFGPTAVTGQTNKTLSIANIQPSQAGGYRLEVNNFYGTAYSNFVQVVVETLPSISVEPVALTTLREGQTLNLTVGAAGIPTVTYQWQRNGVALTGKTSATLSVPSILRNQAGEYTVVVTNKHGSVTSKKALVVVEYAPELTLQPAALELLLGQSGSLSSAATGVPAPTYQWFRDGNPVSGATANTLNWSSISWADRGLYRLEVKNSVGSVLSTAVEVKVKAIPRALDLDGKPLPISLDRTAGVYGP